MKRIFLYLIFVAVLVFSNTAQSQCWGDLRNDITAAEQIGPDGEVINPLRDYLKTLPKETRLKVWEILFSLGDEARLDPVVMERVRVYFEETNINVEDFQILYQAESNKDLFFARCILFDNIDFLRPFRLHDAFRVDKPKVLSLGEGNFSFSASISGDLPEINRTNFLATEYRTYEQLAAADNIDQSLLDDALAYLSSNFVDFRFGVDGANLPPDIGNFDVVIFNFPFVHNPPNSISLTRQLLENVVLEMESRLNSGGKLFITQKSNWANVLDISSLADNSVLTLVGNKKWNVEDFPGYQHVITNPDNTGSANVTTGLTYVFYKE